jgi:hypothetical protein
MVELFLFQNEGAASAAAVENPEGLQRQQRREEYSGEHIDIALIRLIEGRSA